jgi:peptidoglycan/LPS O-acetylase OafA/YrhL
MSNKEHDAAPTARRLLQIDGLRAIAALLVVAYHYTYGFEERFHHVTSLGLSVTYGYLGVYLFFAISGFVIFMTLERCRQPLDFVASRVARLFPTYWVAVALTFLTLQVLTIPGYAVTWPQAIANLAMVHAFFGVPDVDGVYWSLQVELLFYIWMLAAWSLGLLRHSLALSFAWVGAGLAYGIAHNLLGIAIPATIPRFLLLESIPWFVIGMTAYTTLRDRQWRPAHLLLFALCLATVATRGEIDRTVAAVLSATLVLLASRGRLPVLTLRPLVFFGAISYPLYLVHEKIGWAVLRELEVRWPSSWTAVAAAVAISVTIATLLHYLVEEPSRRALRDAYARRTGTRVTAPPARTPGRPALPDPLVTFPRWAVGSCLLIVFFAAGGVLAGRLAGATRAEAAPAPAIEAAAPMHHPHHAQPRYAASKRSDTSHNRAAATPSRARASGTTGLHSWKNRPDTPASAGAVAT